MFAALRDTLVLLLVGGQLSNAQSTADSTGSAPEPATAPGIAISATAIHVPATRTVSPSGTCPNRPINHLAHSVPLQCLRKDRFAPSGTQWPAPTDRPHDSPVDTATVLSASRQDSHSTDDRHDAVPTASETSTTATHPTSQPVDTTDTTAVSTAAGDAETDVESALDNANFLSFEEWKKQNLAKAGQSPDAIGQGTNQPIDGERTRPGITNALDSLGEENEIDLDFGFGRPSSTSDEAVYAATIAASASESATAGSRLHRSKDAGKTCKERTNYASFDCAANVLKSNPECKSASSVLVEHKDSYMLNICSAQNKFFIVELCDDIQIDTIVLANYEFFSSVFRQFRVSVSDRYPVKLEKWKVLGTFEARNTREIQAFLVENPMIWAKYLRIEILSHYGNEYYCPVSLLRVHGTTMMQDYRHEEELARGEVVEDVTEPEVQTIDAVDTAAVNVHGETQPADVHAVTEDTADVPSTSTGSSTTDPEPANPATTDSTDAQDPLTNITSDVIYTDIDSATGSEMNTCPLTHLHSEEATATERDGTPTPSPSGTSVNATQTMDLPSIVMVSNATTGHSSTEANPISAAANSTVDGPPTPAAAHVSHDASSSSVSKLMASLASSQNMTAFETGSSKGVTASSASSNSTKVAVSTSTAPQPPQPSTQESFFKSITKRLQQLESNSTLSLQYIEEQSRILRDAFSKVEKRQSTNALNFLAHLNSTVMHELQGFRQAYDQIWQNTVIELENHREAHQREMMVLSRRLSIVADELLWQKRMGIIQSSLLLLCLGLVLFTRSSGGLQELPFMQQVMNRSQAAFKAGWDSDPGSPPRSRGTPSSLLRHGLWRKGYDATDSRPESQEGLDVRIEPPTPPSRHAPSGRGIDDEDESHESYPETQSRTVTPTGAYSRHIELLGT